MPERPAVSYIVIEVRERSPADAGFLRHLIHGLAAEHGLDVADIIVRHDRETSCIGTPEPWELIRSAFWSCMPSLLRGQREVRRG